MLASTQISDKSHSWLAYSSPLVVHWDPCKSYNANVTFFQLGGQLSVFVL